MQALHSWLISLAKRTTVYQDWTIRPDAAFLRNFESSAAVLNLRNHAAKAETFLRCRAMPIRASRNVKDQIDVLCGTLRHPKASVSWMDALRHPVDPLTRSVIVCATAIVSAILIVWPIVNAFLLHEYVVIVLGIAANTRTAIMALALLRFRYISPRLVWKLLEKRLISILPSLVAYSLPAFDKRLHHLHGLEWYTFVVAALLFIWLVLISFSAPLRAAIEQRSMPGQWPLSSGGKCEAEKLLEEIEIALDAVYELVDSADISDWMKDLRRFLKADCDDLIKQLAHCCGNKQTMTKKRYARAPKAKVVAVAAGLFGLGLIAYRRYPIALAERSASGTWVLGQLLWYCISPYLSSQDILDLFSRINSGAALAFVTVTLAVLVTDGAVLDRPRNLVVLTCVHTVATLMVASHVGPFLVRVMDLPAMMCGWVNRWRKRSHKPDEPDPMSYIIDWNPPPRSPIVPTDGEAHNDDGLPTFPGPPDRQIGAQRNSVVRNKLWSVEDPGQPIDGVSEAALDAVERRRNDGCSDGP